MRLAVLLSDELENAGETGHAVSLFRRKVGTAVERLAVRSQEHGHRPSTAPGEHLHRVHVDVVDVGSFFAVDLDVDVVLVHQRRDVSVLERFSFHHMAPVTGRVADTQEDRFVFLPRRGERLLAPGIPVDGIVRVLQQVGTGLVDQAVGMLMVGHSAKVPASGRSYESVTPTCGRW